MLGKMREDIELYYEEDSEDIDSYFSFISQLMCLRGLI